MKAFHILDKFLQLKRHFSNRSGPATGVLLISSGGLGDTVLFSLLASRFKSLTRDGEPITVLLRNDARKMAFLLPGDMGLDIVNFHEFRKSLSYRREVGDRLFNAHYRLLISTDQLRHPDLDEALVKMAAPEEAIAMEPRSWPKYDVALKANRKLYSRLFDSGSDRLDKVLRWNRFLDWLTGTKMPPPKVQIDLEERSGETFDILIQPFSAVARKQSPVAVYRQIIESLPLGMSISLTGAPGDMIANPDFKELLSLPGVSFNSNDFVELVPALKAAKLVISVDTALMHLAVALGAPTVCLASAAYVGEIVPYAQQITPENAHFIYQSMDCEGCLGKCHLPPVNGMYPCVAGIEADQVISLIKEIM